MQNKIKILFSKIHNQIGCVQLHHCDCGEYKYIFHQFGEFGLVIVEVKKKLFKERAILHQSQTKTFFCSIF